MNEVDHQLAALRIRVTVLEQHMLPAVLAGRAQSVMGLAWSIIALCVLAFGVVIWYGAKFIGG